MVAVTIRLFMSHESSNPEITTLNFPGAVPKVGEIIEHDRDTYIVALPMSWDLDDLPTAILWVVRIPLKYENLARREMLERETSQTRSKE